LPGKPTFDESVATRGAWDRKVEGLMAAASPGFNQGFHTSQEWVRNDFHAQLKNTALGSIALSLVQVQDQELRCATTWPASRDSSLVEVITYRVCQRVL
jgi:hypothetical protein